MNTPEPNEQLLERMKQTVKNRSILQQALTPEVRTAMRETFGLNDMVFAFDESGDAIKACRRDTMRGVIEALFFEADHADESKNIYAQMTTAYEEEQANQ